jgi:formylglycine-generating enzyme required for sulfatase activity
MHVDSPPAVPSRDSANASSTANSFVVEDEKSRQLWKSVFLIVAAAFVLAIVVAFQSGWRPWATEQEANGPTKTNQQATDLMPHTRTNQTGIEFVSIPPGSFMMGSTNGDEKPLHQVTIDYSFDMGKYEVTQTQWQAVMGHNPSKHHDCGGDCPVESVSWDDAQKFIQRLNRMNDGYIYRLPTESEWEYACRAGTTGDYAGNLDAMAWYYENAGDERLSGEGMYDKLKANNNRTHPVGKKQPNAFGLYDMNGNVWEWCQDWYHESYIGAPTDGSAWLTGGEQKYRVVRGGSWSLDAKFLRSAYRSICETSDSRDCGDGFRVVAVR